MQVILTTRHMKASDALKQFVDEELADLQKYNTKIADAEVILDDDHEKKIAEVLVRTPQQKFFASHESDNIRKSVTLAVEKLARQLKDAKVNRKHTQKAKVADDFE